MKRINVASGAKWEGIVGYSRAVRAGDLIAVTGTVALGPDGELVGEGDAYAQALQALRNIETALVRLGSGLEDVIRTRIYVTDIERDWQAVGRAHAELLGDVRPATTMVEVSRLIDPCFLVEIEADARPGLDPPAASPRKGVAPNAAEAEVAEANIADASAIAALLEAAALPVPDERDRAARFLVARADEGIVGCVGWEEGGEAALLRSLAVAGEVRGRGVGSALVKDLARRLGDAGVRELYLLTVDAQDFFARFGFAPVDRAEVPETITTSREFSIHCCDSAVCLRAPVPL